MKRSELTPVNSAQHGASAPRRYKEGSKTEFTFPESLHGCSLAAMARMLQKDYTLYQLEHHDALFIRTDLAPQIAPAPQTMLEIWEEGWFCTPLLLSHESAAGTSSCEVVFKPIFEKPS